MLPVWAERLTYGVEKDFEQLDKLYRFLKNCIHFEIWYFSFNE